MKKENMNNRETIERVEKTLTRHFRKTRTTERLRGQHQRVKSRIDNIRDDMKNCNYDLNTDLRGIHYENTPTKTLYKSSAIEGELMRVAERLEDELYECTEQKYDINKQIRDLEIEIGEVEYVFDQLEEEDMELIQLRYGKEMTFREIANRMLIDSSTAKRKKDKLLIYLATEFGYH